MKYQGYIPKEGKAIFPKGMWHTIIEKNRGYEVWLKVWRVGSPKTPEQLGYLFGVVYLQIAFAMAEMDGETNPYDKDHLEKIHRYLSNRFGQKESKTSRITGEEILIPVGLRADNIAEAAVYIDKVVEWAQEFFGIVIMPPDKQHKMSVWAILEMEYPHVAKRYSTM